MKFDQRLALTDMVAFLDKDLFDDAAFEMLNDLHLVARNDLAGRNSHLVEFGEIGPYRE